MHWHGYEWSGNGADLAREWERRPDSPEFSTSPLPPARTGDWLAKPASRISGTFMDVEAATMWMAGQYKRLADALPHPDRIGLDPRLQDAMDLLPRGVDVLWGEWLTGGRFITIAMICCPNRHTSHPCPTHSRWRPRHPRSPRCGDGQDCPDQWPP